MSVAAGVRRASLSAMKVEFLQPGTDEPTVVATATWDGHDVTLDAGDPAVLEGLARAFRRTPVVVDDPAYRRLGTHGDVLVAPGDLEWFRAVAQVRVVAETGLVARFVPGISEGGYDPAAGYRRFEEQIDRLTVTRPE